MSSKDTNPKDFAAAKKLMFSVIPWTVIWELGVALVEGALKYGRYNWRDRGCRASIYFDATLRHLGAWWEGEDYDPDVIDKDGNSLKLSHITKAIASLTVLRDSMLAENWIDDRPKRSAGSGSLQRLSEITAKLIDRYRQTPVGEVVPVDSASSR